MNSLKMKLLDELQSHLSMLQGKDLKELLDQAKMKVAEAGGVDPMVEGSSSEEASESPMEEKMEEGPMDGMFDKGGSGKPKGIAIEKVSLMGKPKSEMDSMDKAPGEEEMSDDELDELLKKALS